MADNIKSSISQYRPMCNVISKQALRPQQGWQSMMKHDRNRYCFIVFDWHYFPLPLKRTIYIFFAVIITIKLIQNRESFIFQKIPLISFFFCYKCLKIRWNKISYRRQKMHIIIIFLLWIFVKIKTNKTSYKWQKIHICF